MKTRYRIVDDRNHAEKSSLYPLAVNRRPFSVQTKGGLYSESLSHFMTIPGMNYRTKEEAKEAIERRENRLAGTEVLFDGFTHTIEYA